MQGPSSTSIRYYMNNYIQYLTLPCKGTNPFKHTSEIIYGGHAFLGLYWMPEFVTHWDPSLLNHTKNINSNAWPGHTREGTNCFKHIEINFN